MTNLILFIITPVVEKKNEKLLKFDRYKHVFTFKAYLIRIGPMNFCKSTLKFSHNKESKGWEPGPKNQMIFYYNFSCNASNSTKIGIYSSHLAGFVLKQT